MSLVGEKRLCDKRLWGEHSMTTRWTVFAQTISLLAARGGVSLGAVPLLGLGVAWGQPTLTATESIDSTTGDLTVSFKETGLGNTPVSYELTAGTVDFYYQCFSSNGSPSNPVTSSNRAWYLKDVIRMCNGAAD